VCDCLRPCAAAYPAAHHHALDVRFTDSLCQSDLDALAAHLPLLRALTLHHNITLKQLHLAELPRLEQLDVSHCARLSSLEVGTATPPGTTACGLQQLVCTDNKLLEMLELRSCVQLTSLDVSGNTQLAAVTGLSASTALQALHCCPCHLLVTLDLSNNAAVRELSLPGGPQLQPEGL
jgi:hypothetical protein